MNVAEKTWSPGDRVVIASGGPLMTVDQVKSENMKRPKVFCQWFDSEGKLQGGEFSPGSLRDAPKEA